MTNSHKILIVTENADLKSRISRAFEKREEREFELEFLSFERATRMVAVGFAYDAAFVDFEPDPRSAVLAAYRLRSIKPDLGIAILAPSINFEAPVEIIELGLGPLALTDDEEGILSLPIVALSLINDSSDEDASTISKRELRFKHQEQRKIMDSLARQSVHLIGLRNELAAEKNKMEALINGMTDAMVFFAANEALEVINPVAQSHFPFLSMDSDATMEKLLNMFSNSSPTRDNGKKSFPESFETEVSGKTYRVRLTKVPDPDSGARGSLFLFTDITQDKEYERLKDDFTNMISHELRTPLTSIRAAVDNFLRGVLGDVSSEQRKFLEIIARNVDRQQELIDNLLDLAKFEANQVKVVRGKVNLAGIVALCIEQFSLAFKDKSVGLTYDAREKIPIVEVDQELIIQALNNLLSNALKFTKNGDKVTVSLKSEDRDGSTYACIEVADTGIGIPPEQIDSIFDKYTQADTGFCRRYAGTGLGLAICHQIASVHAGVITARSELGEGSAFSLYLPISSET